MLKNKLNADEVEESAGKKGKKRFFGFEMGEKVVELLWILGRFLEFFQIFLQISLKIRSKLLKFSQVSFKFAQI